MQTYFEITPQQKRLGQIGREMMDFSEEYGKIYGLRAVTDDGLRVLNNLSHVGHKLTMVGGPWGTTKRDFSEDELQLISDWMQKKVDIERK